MTFHRTSAGPKAFLVAMLFMLMTVGCSDAVDDPELSGAGVDDQSAESAESVDTSGGSDEDVFAGPLTVIIPNSPGTISTTGEQRIMTALVGDTANSFLGNENNPVSVTFQPVDGEGGGESDGTWLTTNAAALGLYVSYFEFPTPGIWEVTVSVPNGESLGAALVEVVEDSSIPNVGDPAPPSVTLTANTAEEIGNISTDLDPDFELYDLSIAEAVGNGRPTVVAFATPAFCQTALCGPTLETVKAAAAGRADLDVVHVEPFDLELAPQGVLQPVDAMSDYGLVTEPWVFVVDADGLVAATFEGIIGQPELEAAIERLGS